MTWVADMLIWLADAALEKLAVPLAILVLVMVLLE